jgi:hypothetical protein
LTWRPISQPVGTVPALYFRPVTTAHFCDTMRMSTERVDSVVPGAARRAIVRSDRSGPAAGKTLKVLGNL